jgi:hypothetical protein
MQSIFRALAVLLGLVAAPLQAAFHLWQINELYSNSDGTVQFVELTALAGDQQFFARHDLTSSSGGNTKTFTFPSNLPGDTLGRKMLIATQGFAALGIVTPDYTVPNNFFFRGGGTVNFADVDVWNHPALPTNNQSLDRSGATIPNSPTNFSGATGSVPVATPPPVLNFQGLWYRGEVESGWGVNVAHQGDILFVTWFTYDTDGSQMWLVGPDVRRTTGDTYAGPLYRTTGPAFNSVPFNPQQVGLTSVGTVTLSFTDGNNGSFSYTLNGVSQSKPIVRQVFSTAPTCAAGTTPSSSNFQDLWYASPAESERGWGLNITHQGIIIFLTWFTYDSNGLGMWIVGPRMEQITGNTYHGNLYRTTGPAFSANPWSPSGVVAIPVGNASFNFTSATTATFNYTVNGINQTKNITRQSFGSPPTVC